MAAFLAAYFPRFALRRIVAFLILLSLSLSFFHLPNWCCFFLVFLLARSVDFTRRRALSHGARRVIYHLALVALFPRHQNIHHCYSSLRFSTATHHLHISRRMVAHSDVGSASAYFHAALCLPVFVDALAAPAGVCAWLSVCACTSIPSGVFVVYGELFESSHLVLC